MSRGPAHYTKFTSIETGETVYQLFFDGIFIGTATSAVYAHLVVKALNAYRPSAVALR